MFFPCAEGRTSLPHTKTGLDVENDDVTDASKGYENIYCIARYSGGRQDRPLNWSKNGWKEQCFFQLFLWSGDGAGVRVSLNEQEFAWLEFPHWAKERSV